MDNPSKIMVDQRHLANAPIKEALIDLRVALPQDTDIEQLEAVHKAIGEQFPVKKIIIEGRFGIRFDPENCVQAEATADHTKLGFRYETTSGDQVVQFGMNGFTYSQLKPYTNWEDMRTSAKSLWQIYLKAASPLKVTRVATRFVNLIHIPIPVDGFHDYLTEPPRIPKTLPQGLASYLTRIVLPVPDIHATAIITQALEPTSLETESIPILLDIDTFLDQSFDAEDAAIWNRLEDLRKLKNKIFFASITQKTMDLFQ